MKSKILAISLLAFSVTSSFSQENITTVEPAFYKHLLGIGAGFCTGYGLSYRFTPNDKLGFQLNFAPYKSKTIDRYSTGISFTYNLIKNNNSRLYAYQANHLYYNSFVNTISIYDPITNQPKESTTERVTEKYMNNGLGFGMEITFAKRIGLNIMTGYAFYNNFKEINVTGEMALYYKF